MRKIYFTVSAILVLIISNCSNAQTPLGPGFTYQGHLQQNGTPINGTVHLRFSLWDAAGGGQPPTGGNQIGISQLVTDVPISEGIFTVVLNGAGEFGASPFDGNRRWLQIEVCADQGCSTLTILSPRQPLTGAPYALNAISASWAGLSGVPAGFADNVDNIGDPVWAAQGSDISFSGGNVGVGTTTPTSRVDIIGQDGLAITGYQPFITLRDSNANNERVVLSTGDGNLGIYTDSFIGGSPPFLVFNTTGAVGIGVSEAPENVRLEVIANQIVQSAISGTSLINGVGVRGEGFNGEGVVGVSENGAGVRGVGHTGVEGVAGEAGNIAISGFAVVNALAGKFTGNVDINGTLYKSSDAFLIDHPLDPGNKFLSHSSVESPEMLNVYSGNVLTDVFGFAEVTLPEYFEALNKDFRYQLTVIGQFAQAIVEAKIQDNRFTIRTDKPSVEVSWQVTGIRNDAYANAHPVEVEKAKPEEERGKYLAPELFGEPKEKGIHYRPELVSSKRAFVEENEEAKP